MTEKEMKKELLAIARTIELFLNDEIDEETIREEVKGIEFLANKLLEVENK